MAVEVWGLEWEAARKEAERQGVCAQFPVSIHPVMVQNTVTTSSPPQLNFSWKASPLRHTQGCVTSGILNPVRLAMRTNCHRPLVRLDVLTSVCSPRWDLELVEGR